MPTINFPASPAVGDKYSYGGFTYKYDGVKWTSSSVGTHAPSVVANGFIGQVEWYNGPRDRIPDGCVAADGQTLLRADEPDLWAEIEAGNLIVSEEQYWLDATLISPDYIPGRFRGMYSSGDGSTTFRTPDLNGVQAGSSVGNFLRGDGGGNIPQTVGAAGIVSYNAAPNILAHVALRKMGTTSADDSPIHSNHTGAFKAGTDVVGNAAGIAPGATLDSMSSLEIDASLSNAAYGRAGADGVSAAVEVRPNAVTGVWIIRAKSLFVLGTVDDVVIQPPYESVPATGTQVGPFILAESETPGRYILGDRDELASIAFAGGHVGIHGDALPDGAVAIYAGTGGINLNADTSTTGNMRVRKDDPAYLLAQTDGTTLGRLVADSTLGDVKLIHEGNDAALELLSDGTLFYTGTRVVASALYVSSGTGVVREGNPSVFTGGSQTNGFEIRLSEGNTQENIWFSRGVMDGMYHYTQWNMFNGGLPAGTLEMRSTGVLLFNSTPVTLVTDLETVRDAMQASIDELRAEVEELRASMVTAIPASN